MEPTETSSELSGDLDGTFREATVADLSAQCVLEMANSSTPGEVMADYFQLALQKGYQGGWTDGYAQASDDAAVKQAQVEHLEGYGAGV